MPNGDYYYLRVLQLRIGYNGHAISESLMDDKLVGVTLTCCKWESNDR